MKPRQFNQDKNAVAYLIFYIIASILVFGGVWAILSDIKDASTTPIYNTISPMGTEFNDADTQWGMDLINLLYILAIILFIISLIWYSVQMSQKPEQPW